MTSPARSFSRDEAVAISPLRNAFASSSNKPLHSPFLHRRPRTSNGNHFHSLDRLSNEGARQPDAISTSSSTLVNAESTSDYRPWEVRSESGSSSLDSFAGSRGGRATLSLSALDDIGTLPSIHITPLPRRSLSRATQASQASSRITNDSARRSVDSSSSRARPKRQLCPADCRCSDQDIDLGLCRRVVGSSSSGSESGSLSVGVHPMERRSGAAMTPSTLNLDIHDTEMQISNVSGIDQADRSQQSSHSQSEPRSQGRDFEKHPILVPRSARSRGMRDGDGGGRSPNSSYQRSFDQLQRGLDTLESNESDADSDADQAQAAQRRAESMARWTARRSSLSQSNNEHRSPAAKVSPLPEPLARSSKSSPIHSAGQSLASEAPPITRRTPGSKTIDEDFATPFSSASPLKATPGRKSIAAVFESMQKQREARAAEEHRQWQEKQARRERERAARAFGVPLRRRTSATSSQFDSPVSASTAFDTPQSQGQTTGYHSIVSRASPIRSPITSVVNVSPLLSSPGSPKVDDSAAVDVQSRHLGEEVAERIPETLAEAEESADHADEAVENGSQSATDSPLSVEQSPAAEAAAPTTPQTKHTSAFSFASQPMALDVSPIRSISDISSPASSPRKNAHKRQNTNTVSVAARLPSASVGAARQRLNQVLGQSSIKAKASPADNETEVEARNPSPQTPYPQTPIGGILSSAKKGLPQLSAARRGHSVRFSPRPDYRSDSGSWDETQSVVAEEDASRDVAVSRLLLPAKQIVIPEVLTAASEPAQNGSERDEEESERSDLSKRSVEEQASQPSPPVKPEPISQPHTPPSPAAAKTVHDSAASFSVRFPGAYANTPVKNYSRHIIRPSPKITRVLPDTIPAAVRSEAATARTKEFGLFPAFNASEIPRESTPPPLPPSSSRMLPPLPPDDPRNSPRSPRPVNLGRERFARFDAGSRSSSSAEESVEDGAAREVAANTAANQQRGGAKGVDATISKILQTVEAAHSTKVKRMQLGQRLNGVGERIDRATARGRDEGSLRFVSSSQAGRDMAEVRRQDEQDRLRNEELRSDVMHALAVLADRIVTLQNKPPLDATSVVSIPQHRGGRGLSRRTMLLLVIFQCAVMAWLMRVAEEKAQRMRMLQPSAQLAYLYPSGQSGRIEWSTHAVDPHLQPLLHLPLLHTLYRRFPPLPALHPSQPGIAAGWWHNYRSYIHLHGLATFLVQSAVYAASQLIACLLLLALAPLQVVWITVQASSGLDTAQPAPPGAPFTTTTLATLW